MHNVDFSELFKNFVTDEDGISKIADSILKNTEGESIVDIYYPHGEKTLLVALLTYLYEQAPVVEQNSDMLIKVLEFMNIEYPDDDYYKTAMDMVIDDIEKENPDSNSVRLYKHFQLYKPSVRNLLVASCIDRVSELEAYDLPYPEYMICEVQYQEMAKMMDSLKKLADSSRKFFEQKEEEDPFDEDYDDKLSWDDVEPDKNVVFYTPEDMEEEDVEKIFDDLDKMNEEIQESDEISCIDDEEPESDDTFTAQKFFLDRENCHGEAIQIAKKFVVLKGSIISKVGKSSMLQSAKDLREKNRRKISRKGVLREDVIADSPSEAAGFVTGLSINGQKAWLTADGRMLCEINGKLKQTESEDEEETIEESENDNDEVAVIEDDEVEVTITDENEDSNV